MDGGVALIIYTDLTVEQCVTRLAHAKASRDIRGKVGVDFNIFYRSASCDEYWFRYRLPLFVRFAGRFTRADEKTVCKYRVRYGAGLAVNSLFLTGTTALLFIGAHTRGYELNPLLVIALAVVIGLLFAALNYLLSKFSQGGADAVNEFEKYMRSLIEAS